MSAEQDRQKAEEERARRVREKLFRMADASQEEEEFYPQSDLFTIKKWIEDEAAKGPTHQETILAAFAVMVTEQPHKTPLVAALLAFLVISPDSRRSDQEDGASNTESLGIKIARHLAQAFRSHVHSRLWRNIRLSLHFFASLVPLGIVAPSSMRMLLGSFAMVLNEPFITLDRGDRAALCIIETLCRSGSHLIRPDIVPPGQDYAQAVDPAALEDLNNLADTVESYAKNRRAEVALKRPWKALANDQDSTDTLHEESFEHSVAAIAVLRARGYRPAAFLPTAADLLPPAIVSMAASLLDGTSELGVDQYRIAMPEILIPPEEDEYEGASFTFGSDPLKNGHASKGKRQGGTGSGGGSRHKAITLQKDEEEVKRAGTGPEKQGLHARWFIESTPLVGTPSAVVLRSLISEIIDLYEVNRRESARILFTLPRFLRRGTFAGKAVSPDTGLCGDADDLAWIDEDEQDPQGGWILDDVLVECILSTSFLLPTAPHVPLYYHALLREVTALSPQTLAPAIGRTVRRIYGCSKSGRVSADVLKRFADWFSVHLSNFNFSWGWKEWIPDMDLTHSHPAKSVARRIVELENRLAYYDRIKSTLPEEVANSVLRPEEPTPCFTYEAEDHPYHSRAAALSASLRARATAPVILAELESMKRELIVADSSIPEEDSVGKVRTEAEAEIVVRDIVIQSVLNIGSRSFSHFLNIVERYHGLLRQLSSSPSMRAAILASTTRFWARSAQWVLIVFDKLMQYRIVEPADVINFVFAPAAPETMPAYILQGSGDNVPASFSKLLEPVDGQGATRDWASFDWYEIVRLTIEKVNGRVGQVRRRLARLQREEAEETERKEAAAAAAAAAAEEDQASGLGGAESPGTASVAKVPFSFPTSASLPARPGAAVTSAATSDTGESTEASTKKNKEEDEEEQRKQTVEEARSSLDSILSEQRKVLAGAFKGLAELFTSQNAQQQSVEDGEEDSEGKWRAWWAREWYLAYLRQFNKDFVTMQETLSAVVVVGSSGSEEWKALFDEACKLAYE